MNSRKIVLAVFVLFLAIAAHAQVTQGTDGLYYGKDDQPFTGKYAEYYDDSAKKAEYSFVNGYKDGISTLYFQNGKINEIRAYNNGLKHGTWITYNDKGIKIGEANYSRDKKNGKWYVWDDNGVLRCEMTYQDGNKVGTWYIYDDKGKLKATKNFDN